jgi:hypothetical protein
VLLEQVRHLPVRLRDLGVDRGDQRADHAHDRRVGRDELHRRLSCSPRNAAWICSARAAAWWRRARRSATTVRVRGPLRRAGRVGYACEQLERIRAGQVVEGLQRGGRVAQRGRSRGLIWERQRHLPVSLIPASSCAISSPMDQCPRRTAGNVIP